MKAITILLCLALPLTALAEKRLASLVTESVTPDGRKCLYKVPVLINGNMKQKFVEIAPNGDEDCKMALYIEVDDQSFGNK